MPQFNFIIPEKQHADLILNWRRQPWVAAGMYSEITHGTAEQEQWLEDCLTREDYRHWLALANNRPIGLVNLQHIDWANKTTGNGYYMGEEDAKPLAGFIMPFLYNHAFFDLGMEVVTAEVIAGNDIMRLNKVIGHEETIKKDAFTRDGKTFDVICLRLTREAWDEKTRYHRFRADFPWLHSTHEY